MDNYEYGVSSNGQGDKNVLRGLSKPCMEFSVVEEMVTEPMLTQK